jgi:hypothetical protein
MKKKDKEKIVKLLLEAGRWGVFAFASAVIAYLLENVGGLELDPTFELILTSGLRFADSALHKSGVAEKGIVRF